MFNLPSRTREQVLLVVLIFLIIGVGGLGVHKQNSLETQLQKKTIRYASTTQKLRQEKSALTTKLARTRKEMERLQDELEAERERNDELEEQVEKVTDSLDKVQKTVKTEPELLKKYSRTFFLSENYRPEELEQIDDKYLAGDESLTIDKRVWPYLRDLLEAARDDDIELLVASAYRPFGEQVQLHDRYTRVFGEGANQFSAQQGYSEHQLGTTVDFTSPAVNNQLTTSFADTDAYEWLQDNAHKYGFVLSYPKGNQFYQFEPWHWRFVGKELAEDLHEEDAYLYNWSQNKIDTYRSEMFAE